MPEANPNEPNANDPNANEPNANEPNDAEVLDNRGLEPPMPMVRTLQAYERLAPGGTLTIRNDRVPVHLLPRLQERGARTQVEELGDGGARVTIRKPAEPEPRAP